MATFTASMYSRGARSFYLADGSLYFSFNSGTRAFGSIGDVLLLGKIPNKSRLVGFVVHGHPGAASAGAAVTADLLVTPARTVSATTTLAALRSGLSFSASVTAFIQDQRFGYNFVEDTDANALPYVNLKLTVSAATATATASFSCAGVVTYHNFSDE